MDLFSFPPIAAVLEAAYTGLHALGLLVTPALAIVLVTLAVRAALVPLGRMQVRAELVRRRLAPKLRELQRRYRKRPEVLQRKTLELYQEERTSPFAGILPALAQAPFLSVLYALFVMPQIAGHPNALLDETLLGVPLGRSWLSLVGDGDWMSAGIVTALLLVAGTTAWFSRRQALRFAEPLVPGDAQSEQSHRMLRIMSWMPFMTVVIAAAVPLAAALYLAVSTTWTLVERTLLRRSLGLLPPEAPAAGARPRPA
ncbi:YidC/Oxa1 family membrane protein insertase [Homoserinibacter sp. YIM 151385]|uniref:YidC/Oxa1 family membrane protein insertase n=1 Tax=Homoserinibacter sp. YIM 151385 TaxID=2985506 RepID=UPI0022EFE470|nr:membrane protein insertase YidC [Homoserinibacter sp. YIM 151385]WBU39114.1 membrane protein insertase YidC [Homoserinibacter sp. YIM 151385]